MDDEVEGLQAVPEFPVIVYLHYFKQDVPKLFSGEEAQLLIENSHEDK